MNTFFTFSILLIRYTPHTYSINEPLRNPYRYPFLVVVVVRVKEGGVPPRNKDKGYQRTKIETRLVCQLLSKPVLCSGRPKELV